MIKPRVVMAFFGAVELDLVSAVTKAFIRHYPEPVKTVCLDGTHPLSRAISATMCLAIMEDNYHD
jgi:hypothetical protein